MSARNSTAGAAGSRCGAPTACNNGRNLSVPGGETWQDPTPVPKAGQRLALAGFRPASLLTARLTVVTLLALLATAASLTVTATVFDARQWGLYIAANTLIALTYALIGVLICPLFGRVGGVLIAFLVPFLDIGIEQSPMLHPQPPAWAHALPGYGSGRVLIDAAITPTFDELGALFLGLGWLAVLTAAVAIMFRRTATAPR